MEPPLIGWLFRPSCPCDPAAKAWVETRLEWLAEEFPDSAFTGRLLVLPTPGFFPDTYDGSKQAVRTLLNRVCGFMEVDPDRIKLKFTTGGDKTLLVNEAGHAIGGAAGTYEHDGWNSTIRIDKSGLHNPMELVGTIAHELAHVRLLSEGRVMQEEFDNELLTDLTVVHFGLGSFLANVPRNWDSDYSRWPGTNLLKPEYMTPPMFGWALAHLIWFRGNQKLPLWTTHLSSAARANVKQGLRYLLATRDSAYRPAGHRHSEPI